MSTFVEESYSFWDKDGQKKYRVRLFQGSECFLALRMVLPTMPLRDRTEQPAILDRLPALKDLGDNILPLCDALKIVIAAARQWADGEQGVWVNPRLIIEDNRYHELLLELGFQPEEDGRFCLPLESS